MSHHGGKRGIAEKEKEDQLNGWEAIDIYLLEGIGLDIPWESHAMS
jgi:hypothetical protein